MQAVDNAIERIRRLPDARIGCNYGQGREPLLRYFASPYKRIDRLFTNIEEITINDWITTSKKQVAILKQFVLPHQLPIDYLYFLEHYGNLNIEETVSELPFFSIYGFFPPSLYTISSDELATFYYDPELTNCLIEVDVVAHNIALSASSKELKFLDIGMWEKFRVPSVSFYLDLAGDSQQYAVFASRDRSKKRMQRVANSLTEWLENVAENYGDFSYLAVS